MPYGKGTYGSEVGRPPKKKKGSMNGPAKTKMADKVKKRRSS